MNQKWPKPVKLDLKLKDMLEPQVDEKYYLSSKRIDAISRWNAQQDPFINMEKSHKSGIVGTITTREADEQSGMKLIIDKSIKPSTRKQYEENSQEIINGVQNGKDTIHLKVDSNFNDAKLGNNISVGLRSGGSPANIVNVFESNHHAGKVYDVNGNAPTFKENHGTGLYIKEATNKGYKEAFDGDGVYINNIEMKRGTVQKDMIQTIKTQPDVGVVVKDHGNYISLKDEKGRFNTQDKRAWKDEKIIGTIATNDRFTPKILNELRIRKITPREALRLMGLDDKRIDLIQDSNLISHNKQYFIAGNSIVVNVLEAIFSGIDFPKDRPLKVFETFSGYGSQSIALENLGYKLDSHISEWFTDAIIAYALLHHNKAFYKYMKWIQTWDKERCQEWLNGVGHTQHHGLTLSIDSKKPNNLQRLPIERLRALVAANFVSHNKGSILDIKGSDLEQYDLLTYSFPCQDLSLAGKGKGMSKDDHTRSGLLWEIERILLELQKENKLPKVLLMENVPQIHSKKHNDNFQQWQAALMKMGYKNTWRDLNAKNYGIPQNRNRTFMVSVLDGEVEDEKGVQLCLNLF